MLLLQIETIEIRVGPQVVFRSLGFIACTSVLALVWAAPGVAFRDLRFGDGQTPPQSCKASTSGKYAHKYCPEMPIVRGADQLPVTRTRLPKR